MKVNVSNVVLPGVRAERTTPLDGELTRDDIVQGDRQIGTVVYVRRRVEVGTQYGWRPAEAHPNSALTDLVDAIRRLPAFSEWTPGGAP